jgi:opacity protein-like surface antigen
MRYTLLTLAAGLLASASAADLAYSSSPEAEGKSKADVERMMWDMMAAYRSNNNRRTSSKKALRGLRNLQKKTRKDGKGKDGGKGKLAPDEPVDATCSIGVRKPNVGYQIV